MFDMELFQFAVILLLCQKQREKRNFYQIRNFYQFLPNIAETKFVLQISEKSQKNNGGETLFQVNYTVLTSICRKNDSNQNFERLPTNRLCSKAR